MKKTIANTAIILAILSGILIFSLYTGEEDVIQLGVGAVVPALLGLILGVIVFPESIKKMSLRLFLSLLFNAVGLIFWIIWVVVG